MTIEIKVPSVGESVTEALLAEWFKQDGDTVEKNAPLFVLETDKVTLEVEAEAAGQLKILVPEGGNRGHRYGGRGDRHRGRLDRIHGRRKAFRRKDRNAISAG